METKTRNHSIDLLKLIFSLAIIAVHVHLFQDISTPLFRILTQSLFRISVPFYFIVSGYYFAGRLNDDRKVSSYIRRLLKIYLIFEAIDILLNLLAGFSYPPGIIVLRFLTTGISRIYWYLISLILTCVLFRKLWQKGYTVSLMIFGFLLYLFAMTFDSFSFLPAGTWLAGLGDLHTFLWVWPQAGFNESVLFLSLGVYLKQKNVQIRKPYLPLALSMLVLIGEGWFCQAHGAADANCYFSLIPCSVLLFLTALKHPQILSVSYGADLSLYIYMVHIYYSYISAAFGQSSLLRFAVTAVLSVLTAVLITVIRNRRKQKTAQG